MPFLLTFLLGHLRGILITVAIVGAAAFLYGMKHRYDEGHREEGRAQVRALISEETHLQCGAKSETPKDCFIAGQGSVVHEYTEKIQAANRTIMDTSAALEQANRSVDTLKAESQQRAKAAAAALAALESRAKDAADKLAALQLAQPTGATPCESACTLLRTSW